MYKQCLSNIDRQIGARSKCVSIALAYRSMQEMKVRSEGGAHIVTEQANKKTIIK